MKNICTLLLLIGLLTACNQKKKDSAAKDSISPKMAETLRQSMKKDLAGSEIQKTNDVDKYCNCIVDSLQTSFTMKEILDAEFTDSKKYRKVKDTCLKSTKK